MKKKMIAGLLSAAMTASLAGCSGTPAGTSSSSASGGNTSSSVPEEETDPVPEIVAGMTIEQKIAQMIMIDLRNWTDDGENVEPTVTLNDEQKAALQKFGFGGVILFQSNTTGTEATARLVTQIQKQYVSSGALTNIPALIGIDQEGGITVRVTTSTFGPGNMALGAADDTNLTQKAASIIGNELHSLGITVDFAPDADINSNPANPVIGVRSFSGDPQIAARHTAAFIAGLQSESVASCIKHFPGHGDTSQDSHTGLPVVDKSYEELMSFELIPFQEGIKAGTDMIMTAHICFPQIETETYTSVSTGEEITLPATLSHKIIADILREDLGYDGIVITDAMNMDAIDVHFNDVDAAKLAINAGADILLMPVTLYSSTDIEYAGQYMDALTEAVGRGEISEARVDEAVTRILHLKNRLGMLDSHYVKEPSALVSGALASVGSQTHHTDEWRITQRCITLVKNTGDVLPLTVSGGEKVLILYNDESDSVMFEYIAELLRSRNLVPSDAEVSVVCYAGETVWDLRDEITSADYIISSSQVFGASQLDPRTDEGYQITFVNNLLEECHNEGKPLIHISGNLPYDIAALNGADVILAAYNSNSMTEDPRGFTSEAPGYGPNLPAAVCAVFGDAVPSGKLPVDIMSLDNDFGFSDQVLYPIGYGLENWGK